MRQHLLWAMLCALIASATAWGQANQRILRVHGDDGYAAPPGANPGEETDWSNAYRYLTDAIARADALLDDPLLELDRVNVWVAAFSEPYYPDRSAATPGGSGDREASFFMRNDVRVYGGFVGGEQALAERSVHGNPTILDGNIGLESSVTDNVRRVAYAFRLDSTPRLDGFTIRNGYNDVTVGDMLGSGLFNDRSGTAVINCTFEANHAHWGGGYASSGQGDSPRLIACRFIGNSAAEYGGGAFVVEPLIGGSEFEMTNCLFQGNVVSGQLGHGGGLAGTARPLRIVNTTFADNTASFEGGGLHLTGGDCAIHNGIFWGNADGSGANQIAGSLAGLTVSHAVVQGGWAGGTAIINADPTLTPDGRLSAGSPAIDAGNVNLAVIPDDLFDVDDDGVTTEETPDLDRGVRVQDGNGDMVVRVDLGAFERVAECAGDVDDDQVVDFADLLALLAAWGPCPGPPDPCAADLTGDGTVGFNDLLIVLANWGPCADQVSGITGTSAPESIQDCIEKVGLDPVKLAACIEAMLIAGTP